MIGLAQAGSLGEVDINRLVRRKVCSQYVYFTVYVTNTPSLTSTSIQNELKWLIMIITC